MNRYAIVISDEAMDNINDIVEYIHDELKEPLTARRYHDDLIDTIRKLSSYADSIGTNPYVQAMFGYDARHIIYKKMAIVYVIRENVVYIKRFIAGSLIY